MSEQNKAQREVVVVGLKLRRGQERGLPEPRATSSRQSRRRSTT